MQTSTIIMLIGIILTQVSVMLTAWIKVRTDLAAIYVEIETLKVHLSEVKQINYLENKDTCQKLDKLTDQNELQHKELTIKVDVIKDSINTIKVDLARKN